MLTKQFSLTEPLWLLTAGAEVQHWGGTGRYKKKWTLFIILQHSVIKSNWRSADHQQHLIQKVLILSKQEKRKLLKMKSFPLKSTSSKRDGCMMVVLAYFCTERLLESPKESFPMGSYKTSKIVTSFSYSGFSPNVIYAQSWMLNPAGSRASVQLFCFKSSLAALQGSLHHDIMTRGC